MPLPRSRRTVRDLVGTGLDQYTDRLIRCAEEFQKSPIKPKLGALADRVGCSRNDIKRYLQAALAKQFVIVTTQFPPNAKLASCLRDRFGLKEAIVVGGNPVWAKQPSIQDYLGRPAMQLLITLCNKLSRIASDEIGIGTDGGSTIFHAVNTCPPLPVPARVNYKVVPLTLGPLERRQFAASVVCRLLASKLDVPQDKLEIVEPFKLLAKNVRPKGNSDNIRMQLELHIKQSVIKKLDLLILGIGTPKEGILKESLSSEEVTAEERGKIIGDICSIPFDANGNELQSIHRDRARLLVLKDLRDLSAQKKTYVIGVAGGKSKVLAIRKALELKFVNGLVTDVRTAEALLKDESKD